LTAKAGTSGRAGDEAGPGCSIADVAESMRANLKAFVSSGSPPAEFAAQLVKIGVAKGVARSAADAVAARHTDLVQAGRSAVSGIRGERLVDFDWSARV